MPCIPFGPVPSRIMIVGEAPTREDMQMGRPFTGSAGWELSKLLGECYINEAEVFKTYFLSEPIPPQGIDYLIATKKKDITTDHYFCNGKMCRQEVILALDRLKQEIQRVQPTVILALGNLALWATTGEWGIKDWRGSELPCKLVPTTKVVPTYHPTTIFAQWSLRNIVKQDIKRMLRESKTPGLYKADNHFTIRPSFEVVMDTLNRLQCMATIGPLKLACDIETRNWHIGCIGLAWSTTEAICIPLMVLNADDCNYWTEDEEVHILLALRSLLCHPNVLVVGQNFIFDAQYIYREFGFYPGRVRDTMTAQHVCFPGMQKSLDFLSSMYCEHHRYWKEDGKIWARDVNEEELWTYNCEDCIRTYEVDTVLQQVVVARDLEYAHSFQQSLFHPVLRMMIRGVRVGLEDQKHMITELKDARNSIESQLESAIGYKVNIKSPKQVQELFYNDLGQKSIRNRVSGQITTNSEALRAVAEKEPILLPIVEKIEQLRSIGIFLSTFLGEKTGKWSRGFLDTDGRLRSSFNVSGAITFRFSSSENAFGTGLNFQNIPKGDE